MMNRHAVLTFLGIAVFAITAIANPSVFSLFNVTPQNDDIVVQWRSMSETGVQYYDVERSSDDVPQFRRLERVAAKGAGATYTFTDNGAFYKPSSGKKFSYRIRAAGSGGDQFSPVKSVVHDVSSVKRSWGMIKELFR
ncbi:MAG: hypothetical protein H7X80_10995 [bacterium]|nr:hypothetical protein [Candidatus Kapabacteria bacterium]